MLFNKIDKIFYCKEPVPGAALHEEAVEGGEQILVKSYGALKVFGRYFLIDEISPLEFVGAKMIDGEYKLMYKSGDTFIWKDSDGNVLEENVHIGMKVKTESGQFGNVHTIGDKFVAVKTPEGIKNFFKKSIQPFDVTRDPLEIVIEARNRAEQYYPLILKAVRIDTTDLLKSAFNETLTQLKQYNPDIKTTEELRKPPETPEPAPEVKPKTSFLGRMFGKKQKYLNESAPAPQDSWTVTGKTESKPFHLAQKYNVVHGEPNTAGKDVHKLTHIDLNPNARGQNDRYLYHYEVGAHRDPIATSNYLDSQGKMSEPHSFVKNGVYIPGEKVEHNGQEHQVVSHIDYNPKVGMANLQNMLVRNKEGKIISIPRNEAKLTSKDFSKHATIQMANGEKKFHHELKSGDTISHNGQEHHVLFSNPEKGHITQNKQTGKLHFHSPDLFEKEYLSGEQTPAARIGDRVKIGSNIFAVAGESQNKGKVIVSRKNDLGHAEHFEVDSDFINDKIVKKRSVKPLDIKVHKDVDLSKIPSPKEILNQEFTAPAKSDLPETPTPEITREDLLKKRIGMLDKNLGEHRKKEGDGDVTHRMGIGDLAIRTKFGENKIATDEILNPEVPLGGKTLIVQHYDPEKNIVKFRKKGDAPNKKLQEMGLDDFKTWIKENEKIDKSDTPKNIAGMRDGFFDDVVKDIATHMHQNKNLNPTAADIKAELTNPESPLKQSLDKKAKEFEKELHHAKMGGSIVEPDDHEKIDDIHSFLNEHAAFDDESGIAQEVKEQMASAIKKHKNAKGYQLADKIAHEYHKLGMDYDKKSIHPEVKKKVAEHIDEYKNMGGDPKDLRDDITAQLKIKNDKLFDVLHHEMETSGGADRARAPQPEKTRKLMLEALNEEDNDGWLKNKLKSALPDHPGVKDYYEFYNKEREKRGILPTTLQTQKKIEGFKSESVKISHKEAKKAHGELSDDKKKVENTLLDIVGLHGIKNMPSAQDIPEKILKTGIDHLKEGNGDSAEAKIVRQHLWEAYHNGADVPVKQQKNKIMKPFTSDDIKEEIENIHSGRREKRNQLDAIEKKIRDKHHGEKGEWGDPTHDEVKSYLSKDEYKLWKENLPGGDDDTDFNFGSNVKKSLFKSQEIPDIVSVAIMKDGKILMGRRRDSGKFTLPGGHAEESDKNMRAAAAREVKEETGIDLKPEDLKELGSEQVISEMGIPINVHAFKIEGDFTTSMLSDPDCEVFRWHYLNTPLPEEVLNNLHAKKNVTLRLLNLQKWEKSVGEAMLIKGIQMINFVRDSFIDK